MSGAITKIGQGPSLTPELQAKVVALVRRGNLRNVAAASVGVTTRKFNDWLRLGAQGQEPYADFLEAIDQAEAEWETRMVQSIEGAGVSGERGEWKASAWMLERRKPAVWGQKTQVDHSINVGEPTAAKAAEAVREIFAGSVAAAAAVAAATSPPSLTTGGEDVEDIG